MKMDNIRYMTFGKYKGKPILWVIARHIGYIMWCFENLKWFKLNDAEQKFYDWQAIAIKKYNIPMEFPVDLMYKHIKDKESLSSLTTPYVFKGYNPYFPHDNEISDLLCAAGVLGEKVNKTSTSDTATPWIGLHHTTMKEIDQMTDEEIEEMVAMGVTPPIIL